MSAPRSDGIVARQRVGLPRNRKSMRLDLRTSTYAKLIALAQVDENGRAESMVGVIEKLIESAYGLHEAAKKFVQDQPGVRDFAHNHQDRHGHILHTVSRDPEADRSGKEQAAESKSASAAADVAQADRPGGAG